MSISSHYYNKSIALYKFWNTKWLPMFSENSHNKHDDHENGENHYRTDNDSYFRSNDSLFDSFHNFLKVQQPKNIFEGSLLTLK
jgi:hypothetical protein